jgi:DNA polymerase-1
VLLCIDLSQAESRVVGVLAGTPELVRFAFLPPWEFDVHTYNASIIFGCAESAVDEDMRYLAKRAVHASNYGMHGPRLSQLILNDTNGTMQVSPKQAQELIDTYLEAFPGITDWHRRTRIKVLQTKGLQNSWGRSITWEYERLGDELWKETYAWCPQSDVGMLTNQYGLKPLWDERRKQHWQSRAILQVHDEIVVDTVLSEAWQVASFLTQSMSRVHNYYGTEMPMPTSVRIGLTWAKKGAGIHEWKRVPTRDEFEAKLTEITAEEITSYE